MQPGHPNPSATGQQFRAADNEPRRWGAERVMNPGSPPSSAPALTPLAGFSLAPPSLLYCSPPLCASLYTLQVSLPALFSLPLSGMRVPPARPWVLQGSLIASSGPSHQIGTAVAAHCLYHA